LGIKKLRSPLLKYYDTSDDAKGAVVKKKKVGRCERERERERERKKACVRAVTTDRPELGVEADITRAR
jgi:hypothetical protein